MSVICTMQKDRQYNCLDNSHLTLQLKIQLLNTFLHIFVHLATLLSLTPICTRHGLPRHPACARASYILVFVNMVRSFAHSRGCGFAHIYSTHMRTDCHQEVCNVKDTSKHLNCFPESPIHHTVEQQLRQHISLPHHCLYLDVFR